MKWIGSNMWAVRGVVAVAALVALWFLVVQPRLDAKDAEIAKQTERVKKLEDDQLRMERDIGLTAQAARDNATAMQNLAAAVGRNQTQTIVVRDAVRQAAAAAGPQPVGAASRAYFDAVAAQQKEAAK